MKKKDLLSISDLSGDDIRSLISDAIDIKARGWLTVLEGKVLALVFEKLLVYQKAVDFADAVCGLWGVPEGPETPR